MGSGNSDGDHDPISKNNWIGPDGTESGPDVPEDWYLTYDGPAPVVEEIYDENYACLLYTSPSPRDRTRSRMPSSA